MGQASPRSPEPSSLLCTWNQEQDDIVCSTGESFVETARVCMRHLAAKADDKEAGAVSTS